ncbi:DUF4747 family protein [Bradyrhizobium oligotrophicum]|uniref:DUF4747 family protein n=1 Tax=Bradyrhizobium oligotrophicum TaxID=44255 RepID=UPI003EBBD0EF
MAREKSIQICALNLAANPHPESVYVSILRQSSRFLVQARGTDYAKITTPRAVSGRNGLYSGRILIWTEIDLKRPWLDLNNEDELSPSLKRSINIPDNARPNLRVFGYVFVEKTHRVYFESKNEFGEGLGPNIARGIFRKLTSQELLGFDSPEVEVTIVPEVDAVDRILKLPRLRMLFMRVTLPNPDTASPAARRRVYERLKRANARQLEEKYVKSSDAEKLETTPEIRETAEVAAENGLVRAEGRDNDGKKLEVSTEEYPKRYFVGASVGTSFLSRLMATITSL